MKNKILIRITLFLAAVMAFSTCGKIPMEEAQDKYDPTMVVPVVFSVTGPAKVLRTKTFDFKIGYSRSGSTWQWTSTDATVKTVSADTKTASIEFPNIPVGDTARIIVKETTSAGVVSADKVIKVKVDPFCPMTIDQFVGQWNVVETGSKPRTSVATVVRGTGANDIVIKVQAGIPGLIGQIFLDWGESFQQSITPGGDIKIPINLDNGTITIPFTYWGQTLPGPYDYWYFGTGTWSGCGTPTITLSFKLDYDGVAPGVARATNTVTMTKQ